MNLGFHGLCYLTIYPYMTPRLIVSDFVFINRIYHFSPMLLILRVNSFRLWYCRSNCRSELDFVVNICYAVQMVELNEDRVESRVHFLTLQKSSI